MDGLQRVSGLRRWSDDDEVEWVRRGDTVDPKRAQRLLLDPTIRVLRFGQPSVVAVPEAQRADYWQRIGPYELGRVDRPQGERTDDHFDCEVTEFRDDQRRVTVTVYEFC